MAVWIMKMLRDKPIEKHLQSNFPIYTAKTISSDSEQVSGLVSKGDSRCDAGFCMVPSGLRFWAAAG